MNHITGTEDAPHPKKCQQIYWLPSETRSMDYICIYCIAVSRERGTKVQRLLHRQSLVMS